MNEVNTLSIGTRLGSDLLDLEELLETTYDASFQAKAKVVARSFIEFVATISRL